MQHRGRIAQVQSNSFMQLSLRVHRVTFVKRSRPTYANSDSTNIATREAFTEYHSIALYPYAWLTRARRPHVAVRFLCFVKCIFSATLAYNNFTSLLNSWSGLEDLLFDISWHYIPRIESFVCLQEKVIMSKHDAYQVGPGSSTQMNLNSLLMAASPFHGRPLAHRDSRVAVHERSLISSHTIPPQSMEERRQTVIHLMNAALGIVEDFDGSANSTSGIVLNSFTAANNNSARSNISGSCSFSQ